MTHAPATISALISALGDVTAVARALSVPVTTVHGWKANNRVPHWRREILLSLAKAKGMDLSNLDTPAAA